MKGLVNDNLSEIDMLVFQKEGDRNVVFHTIENHIGDQACQRKKILL